MAVEGDLKDIDIASVIQVLCTERRCAGLVLRRRGEEGVIFFDNGEIVHAILGPLEGEEAVYQLLAWRDGSFRMSDKVRTPAKSIRLGWNHLLMEGMRKLDEERRAKGLTPTNGKAVGGWREREADAALAGKLMLLLSQLEQDMVRLSERKVERRPLTAVEILSGMVNHLITFAEEASGAGEKQLALDPILSRAGRKHPMARLLTTHLNRLSARTASDLYRTWSSDPTERRTMFREICRGMVAVLETYLELLARQVESPPIAEEWRESYAVFLRDLERIVDRVRF